MAEPRKLSDGEAMRQTPLPLLRTVAPCLLLAACASTASSTAFAPAPSPGLRSAGYVAPEIRRADAPRTASQMQAAPGGVPGAGLRGGPVRIAQARPAPVAPSPLTPAPTPVSEPAPEVPAAPSRDWSAPPRAPLPDLDRIVVTREETRLAEAPPTRSVLPDERAPRPAAPAPRAMPEGGYALHLASYRQAEQADAGWQVLVNDHPLILGRLAPARAAVDLPEQGRFHRLLAGPLPAGAAEEHCAALEAEGGYCAVVPWSGTRL